MLGKACDKHKFVFFILSRGDFSITDDITEEKAADKVGIICLTGVDPDLSSV